jgi:hypothetical protein
MKKIKSTFSASLFVLLFSANALAAHSKFICNYQANSADKQPLTFEAQEDVDLTNPKQNTILLYVNGGKQATLFNVKQNILHVGVEIVYSYQNKFFVSDIVIKYAKMYSTTTFNGSWKTDYPYESEFNCSFLN